jgi:hypothetical protein
MLLMIPLLLLLVLSWVKSIITVELSVFALAND